MNSSKKSVARDTLGIKRQKSHDVIKKYDFCFFIQKSSKRRLFSVPLIQRLFQLNIQFLLYYSSYYCFYYSSYYCFYYFSSYSVYYSSNDCFYDSSNHSIIIAENSFQLEFIPIYIFIPISKHCWSRCWRPCWCCPSSWKSYWCCPTWWKLCWCCSTSSDTDTHSWPA